MTAGALSLLLKLDTDGTKPERSGTDDNAGRVGAETADEKVEATDTVVFGADGVVVVVLVGG